MSKNDHKRTSANSDKEETAPVPSRALLEMVESQDWSESLRRLASHPQDLDFVPSDRSPSILHSALRRKLPRPGGEDESAFLEFFALALKARPSWISSTVADGSTLLHVVCGNQSAWPKSTALVTSILDRCPSRRAEGALRTSTGLPPDLTRAVLSYVPNPALTIDSHGKTPLFLACQRGKKRRNVHRPDVVRLLLESAPEATRIEDKTSRTPSEAIRDQKRWLDLIDLFPPADA